MTRNTRQVYVPSVSGRLSPIYPRRRFDFRLIQAATSAVPVTKSTGTKFSGDRTETNVDGAIRPHRYIVPYLYKDFARRAELPIDWLIRNFIRRLRYDNWKITRIAKQMIARPAAGGNWNGIQILFPLDRALAM